MRKAFTVIEVLVVVCFLIIIAGMLIPAIHMVSKSKDYQEVIGKTFTWNKNKILVTDYSGGKYKIVILQEGQSVPVEANAKIIMEAYKKSKTNLEVE